MSKISVALRFALENDQEGTITINNIAESTTNVEIGTVVNGILTGNTQIKGQKLLKLKSCKKIIVTEEELYF